MSQVKLGLVNPADNCVKEYRNHFRLFSKYLLLNQDQKIKRKAYCLCGSTAGLRNGQLVTDCRVTI